jgi:CysZ protein
MLLARGLVVAVASALMGLIPVVGSVLSASVAVTFTGWLLADELTARALTARGIVPSARRKLLRRHRGRVLGFGIATQLSFFVPFGAVATMPAAVAGSTLLARSMLETAPGRGESPSNGGVTVE